MTTGPAPSAVVLRHLAFEDLGTFADAIRGAGYHTTMLDCGVDDLSAAEHADLVVVLGGPIGAYEDEHYPWLADEIALLRRRLDQSRPTLGICLGAQLMAAALGAKVRAGAMGKEIGFAPITLTPAGETSPLRHLAPSLCRPLHWHGDTFDLPAGASLLASTPKYPNQAFAMGQHALALQFHPEFQGYRIEQWLVGHTGELRAERIDRQSFRQDAHVHGAALARQGRAMIDEWLAGLRP